MPSDKKTPFTAPANTSQQGTPEWLYDEIMRHIEPDLTTAGLALHKQKYENETRDQRAARLRSYDMAFAIFDESVDMFVNQFEGQVRQVRAKARRKAINQEKKAERSKLKDIESQFGDA